MKKLLITIIFACIAVLMLIVGCVNQSPPISVSDTTYHSLGCNLLDTIQYKSLAQSQPIETDVPLPTVYIIPTPTPGSQGSEGSCVAWGTTYAGRSIDWYINSGATSYSYNTNIFSPEYVYNQTKLGTCASGTYVTSALNLLKNQGVCTWATMPAAPGCDLQPNATQRAEAANYKIINYATASINVNTFKQYLANNQPIIVAGRVNTAFEYLHKDSVLRAFTGTSLGGHCYCVIGYDDSKGAFKFMNSWGSGWSSQGFGWISYSYINQWWSEAYIITSTVPPPPPPPVCTLSVRPNSRTVGSQAGSYKFSVETNGCLWTATSNVSWCVVSPAGIGNGKLTATYEANTSTTDKRTATITITTAGGSTKIVFITQRHK